MSTTHEPGGPEAVSSRRMARRLLSGAGCATVTAYRYTASSPLVVLHALDADGRVLVAAHPTEGHVMAAASDGEALDVRLDVTLEAAEPGLCVTAATSHLLGVLTWLDEAETSLVLAGETAGCHYPITGENPLESLATLACAPGGRLGVVTTDRVMVHDALGVSGYPIEEVVDPGSAGAPAVLWSAADSMCALEEVGALGDGALDLLCTGVVEGAVPGMLCSHREAGQLAPSLWDRVLCVDVAPDTVTLMRLSRTCIDTVQLWLPAGTKRAAEVAPHLRTLVQDRLLADLLRP